MEVTNKQWISYTGEPIKVGDHVVCTELRQHGVIWVIVDGQAHNDEPWIEVVETKYNLGPWPRFWSKGTVCWDYANKLVKVDPSWNYGQMKLHLGIIGVEWHDDH